MTSLDRNIGIYEKFKKPYDSTTSPMPTPPPIPNSEATLSYLLRSNVVDDVPLLQPTDFVKEKKPLCVYVSSLLRTWETAFLLFLQFLINISDPGYIPVLILVVSPFLREKENYGINASNKPGGIIDNIMQFLKFIDLYILLSNLEDDTINEIRDKFKSYPKKFNLVVEFSSTQKLYIHVDTTTPSSIVFEYQIIGINSSDHEIQNYLKTRVSLSDENITFIKSIVSSVSNVANVASSSRYVKYNDTLSTPTPTQVDLPYALTQMDESNFDNFETFSVYSPDIFNYLKWVISVKKHPKNIPIFVVSHSGTMQKFLKKIFYCFNKGVKNITPSIAFIEMYEHCTKTNVWSFRLNYMGYSVIVFRHGFTCDNMYKEGNITFDRIGGEYSNLSIWGICSVIQFYELNKEILINLTDIRESILSIMPGFQKQNKTEISKKNEITCGSDIDSRFNNKNTKNKILIFNCTSSTNLEKYMQPMRVNSVLDSDIDKDIQELISIEFTDCPDTGRKILGKTFNSTFGCIKLSCVYNGKYVIIYPTLYSSKDRMYKISFYNTDGGLLSVKDVQIDNQVQNIYEYEKILLYLLMNSSDEYTNTIMSNFNISSVVNILIDTTMERIVNMLENSTTKPITAGISIYSP
jgi:hypothetical protein